MSTTTTTTVSDSTTTTTTTSETTIVSDSTATTNTTTTETKTVETTETKTESVFVELLGETLRTKDGTAKTAEALEGKIVGLYFSAHWCPPCRKFTPEFGKAYTTSLKAKNFEVVFCSSDENQAKFDGYYNEMPWLALPFADRGRKEALSTKFKVSGIPALIILNSDGEIITTEGRVSVSSDPTGKNFPWVPKTISELIGNSFHGKDGMVGKEAIQGKTLGLYFSAHWCGPCQGFTPVLAKTYKKLKEQKEDFEIVFVSSDRDEEEWKTYYDSMPWIALPFKERDAKQALCQRFNIRGIPSLIILDAELNIITPNAVAGVRADPNGSDFPWPPKLVNDIDICADGINKSLSFIAYTRDMDATETKSLEASLLEVATEVVSEAKAKKSKPEFVFFTSSLGDGNMTANIKKLCLSGIGSEVKGIMLDIDNGGYYPIPGEALTADVVRAILTNYKAGGMKMMAFKT